ncbi:MAG: type II toxin-antitoxin system RelB/DinJ family antitoxin [Clostridia bacterium]|nr:type II toxin-antitoxin system RelB/DinJ family antitoxin [Clostridia bacterium]
MSTVNVTFRIDENLKADADELFSDLGLSLSAAFNMFLRQSLREQGIPFAVTRKEPNTETLAAIEEVINRRNLHGPFNTVEDLMEDLNAED